MRDHRWPGKPLGITIAIKLGVDEGGCDTLICLMFDRLFRSLKIRGERGFRVMHPILDRVPFEDAPR